MKEVETKEKDLVLLTSLSFVRNIHRLFLSKSSPMAPPPPAPKFGAPLYCAGWASPEIALVAGGGGKASSGIPNR